MTEKKIMVVKINLASVVTFFGEAGRVSAHPGYSSNTVAMHRS